MRYRCNAIYPSLLAILSSATCTTSSSSSSPPSWDQPAEIDLPADGYTITDFNNWKKQLDNYTPKTKLHPHRRPSTKCTGCEVLIHIGPIGNDTDVGPDKAPAKARIVARILNKDQDVEAMYKLQPEDKAEYFIWLTAAAKPSPSGSVTQWTLVQITKSGKAGLVQHVDSGYEVKCGEGQGESDADFYACYKIHPESRPISKTSSPISRSELISWSWVTRFVSLIRQTTDTTQRPEGDPAWLRCTQGCCTAAPM